MKTDTKYTSEYKESERIKQTQLLGTDILYGAKGNGFYYDDKGAEKTAEYILKPEDSLKCFYHSIRTDMLEYFEKYDITWWKQYENRYFPSGHLLSSQNHCLNHLFHIRKDPDAVLELIRPLGEYAGIHFDKVLPSFIDTYEAYYDKKNQEPIPNSNFISFEFVCDNIRSLGESRNKRGSKCTSVDVFVYAQAGNEKWLVPIEWKYTEVYSHETDTSRNRYSKYLHPSSRLNGWVELYEKDPFYEFSRQTLLMENLIINKPLVGKYNKYPLQANNFLHIVVVPDGNIELLKDVETFRETIKPESRNLFLSIDPEKLISPLGPKYPELVGYLRRRYWNGPNK